jgi:tape measure domain-containing protein
VDIAELGFRIDSSQTVKATKSLDGLTAAAGRTEAAAGRTAKAMTATEASAARMARSVDSATSFVKRLAGALLTIQAVRQVGQLADAYTNLTSKIRNVTDSEAALVRVRAQVYDIAQRTRQEYATTGELYTRLTRSTEALGLSEEKRLRITETLNKMLIINGATTAEASSAITQLTQGLAAGALRGQEFNSISEASPAILEAIAKFTGRARTELRGLAADGFISAEVLADSLAAAAEETDRQFANMTVTIGGAMTTLENAFLNFIGGADQSSEASRALAEMIQSVAQALDLVAPHVNSLVALWRSQATEQQNVSTTAQDVAHGMKVVVTGLVIAKNGVDALIASLKLAGSIIANWGSSTAQTFANVGDLISKTAERFKGGIGTNDGLLDDFFAKQKAIVTGFTEESGADFKSFQDTLTQSVTDVADAFEFLNNPLKQTELIAADTEKGLRTLGVTTVMTAEAAEKLAKTEKQMADLLGRLRGATDPVAKAWEDYEKAKRDAWAIGKSLIAQGKSEAEVMRLVAQATGLAADNRDREIDAIMAQQGAAAALLSTMEREAEIAGMSADARELATAQMRAEEDMLRAINAANEKGAKIDKKRTDELVKQARAFAADTIAADKLQQVLSEFNDTPMDRLRKEIERVGAALREATDPEVIAQLQNSMDGLNGQMISFATDAIGAGISSLQSMASEGSKAYKALAVAQAANNVAAAIGAILEQGKGDPYTAFARMAAMAAAVAGLVGSIGSFSASGPSASSAQSRQETQGRGTVLGAAQAQSESIANAMEITADATSELVGINRGMLRALQSMQAGIGAASGSIARTGFADLSLDSAMGPLLDRAGNTIAGRIFGAIFGGDQDLIDQGLLIGGGSFGNVSRDPRASSFQTIETDGGWFGSDDIDDELEALGEQATTQIRLILESIGDAVAEGARALGLDMEEVNAAIAAFEIEEIRISTMDLTGEEAQRELEAVFSTIFDGLAGHVVPFIAQFQRVGEGLGETLVRVATSVQVAQEGIYQLGLTVDTLDPERMAQMSVALVEAAGGIEEFISGMQSFVANFAPASHQFAIAQDSLTRALAEVGLVVPETRTGMWELMQSLDATTASGQQQIATLLRLAGVADSYYSLLEDGADSAAEAARALADAAAAAAEEATAALAILLGVANDRAYSNMTTAQRAIADVNSRFSDLRVQLNATNPTLAEAAELERARTQAIEDATAALRAQGQELVDELLFEESLVGLTEVQTAIVNINREFDGYVDTLIDLGFAEDSAEVATINRIRAARLLRAEEDAVAETTRGLTVSFSDMRDSMVAIIQDLRAQFEHLMDPGFRNWIEGLTGISPSPQSDMVTRAGTISTVQQGYAGAISSIGMQIAAAQSQLAALGSISVGPERALLKSRIEMLRAMLLDVTGTMSEAIDYVNDLFDQQIGDLLATLREEFGTEDEIGKINARFDKLIEQATAWGASVEQLAEIEQFRMMALMLAQEDMYESQLAQIRHLQGFLDGMLLSPDSPLSATERTEEAWAQFQAAVEAGNVEEATRLADVYLQLLRDSQASGDDFNSQFWAVRDILTAMRDGVVQAITDDATEQYLADIAAGGVMQLNALDRLNATMESIRVALGGEPGGTIISDPQPWIDTAAQGYAGSATTDGSPAMAAEFALLREELAAIKEAVRGGADKVATTVEKTGERSDRTNEISRARHAQPTGRSVRG